MKVDVHDSIEEVVSLVQSKWHFSETELAPGCNKCSQKLRICIHCQGPDPLLVSILLTFEMVPKLDTMS